MKWALLSAQRNRALREYLATLTVGSESHRLASAAFAFWSELAAHLRGEIDFERPARVIALRAILSGGETE